MPDKLCLRLVLFRRIDDRRGDVSDSVNYGVFLCPLSYVYDDTKGSGILLQQPCFISVLHFFNANKALDFLNY